MSITVRTAIGGLVSGLLILWTGAEVTMAQTTDDESRARGNAVQVGFFGNLDLDDGERNLLLSGSADWVVWRGIIVHTALSFEERVSSFTKTDLTLGAGYLIRLGQSSVPIWVGPGLTNTGLWKHDLSRNHFRVGAGYRYHVVPTVGIGVNQELFFYGEGRTRASTVFGLVYCWVR